MNLLIAGSSKFEDEKFVHGTLDAFFFNLKGQIDTIYTSRFSGACEFARTWVSSINDKIPKNEHIVVQDFTFDMHLQKENSTFYEQASIPDFILSHPFFQKGKEDLIKNKINAVLVFPNKENLLGASTTNIMKFAHLANISCLDCSDLYSKILSLNEQVKNTDHVPTLNQKNKLVNQYGRK